MNLLVITSIIVLTMCFLLICYLNYNDLQETFKQRNLSAIVISLKRRPNRLEKFYENYDLGVECITKEAVDGTTLDKDLLLQNGTIDENTTTLLPSDGAIGCYISHYEVWKNVKEGEVLIVFEDDAYSEKRGQITIESLNERISDLPRDWHIYVIGHPHSVLKTHRVPDTMAERIEEFCGTHAYVINYSGATTLIDYNAMFPIDKQIDGKMSEMSKMNLLNMYLHKDLPMYASGNGEPSDIQ